MPRTRTATTEDNGTFTPRRSAVVDQVPNRGRKGNTYPEWAAEIEELRQNPGKAFGYEDVPDVGNLQQGLGRVYGVVAQTRDVDRETRTGTLWLSYPAKPSDPDDPDSEPVVDEDEVQAIIAKYNR